jgi:hypothetical protein
VYRASGQFHGTASPNTGLENVNPTSEIDCFGQRATNAAMKKGGGIDVLWGGFWPYHLEIDSYIATTAVLVGSADAAENYDNLSWWQLWRKQSQYRRDLSRIVSKMALYAKIDPNGTQLATGGLGDLMNIKPNGYYVDIGRGVASYSDVNLRKHSEAQPSQTLASTAVTRLFQDAYGPVWCERYSGTAGYAALHTLKNRVAQASNSESQAAACGVCTSVVKRHIRPDTGRQSAHPSHKSLCQYVYEADLLDAPAATIYHNGSASSPAGLAADWCGCPTLQ